jgi:hypothetical protein
MLKRIKSSEVISKGTCQGDWTEILLLVGLYLKVNGDYEKMNKSKEVATCCAIFFIFSPI